MEKLNAISGKIENTVFTSKSELVVLQASSEPEGSSLDLVSGLLHYQERDEHGQGSQLNPETSLLEKAPVAVNILSSKGGLGDNSLAEDILNFLRSVSLWITENVVVQDIPDKILSELSGISDDQLRLLKNQNHSDVVKSVKDQLESPVECLRLNPLQVTC